MLCENCSAPLKEGSKFCEECGFSIPQGEENAPIYEPEGDPTSTSNQDVNLEAYEGLVVNEVGAYNWMYEFSLLKDPAIFITTFKVLLIALLVPTLLMFGLTTAEDGIKIGFDVAIKVFSYGLLLEFILLIIAYGIIALIYGGKYFVFFSMDEKGVNHIQLDKQQEKASILGLFAAFAGLATGNLGVGGAGVLAATKKNQYTSFKKVKSVKIIRKRNIIYINEALKKNQVYVRDEDFPFVEEYIISKCPENIKLLKK